MSKSTSRPRHGQAPSKPGGVRQTASDSPPALSVAWFWAGVALLAIVGLALLVWSWGRSADVLVDFGREAYVPWRLAEGDVLYRDLAYFNGPFSPYANSLVFRLLGTGIAYLAIANAVVLALTVTVVMRMAMTIANRWAALACGAWIVLVFECGHYTEHGNYNFLYPYSHEATHGLLASLAALWWFGRYVHHRRLRCLVGAGLLVGVVLLTKPEIFIAVALASIATLSMILTLPSTLATRLRVSAAFAVGVLLLPLLSFALLCMAMPASDALRGTLGGLVYMSNELLVSQKFYRDTLGISALGDSVTITAKWIALYALVLGSALAFALRTRHGTRGNGWLALMTGTVTAAMALAYQDGVRTELFFALPTFMAVAAAAGLWTFWGRRFDVNNPRPAILANGLIVFSLALLFKILFWTNLGTYGFYLALPGTVVLMLILLHWVPRVIDARGGYGMIFRAAWLGPVVVFVGLSLNTDHQFFAAKTFRVAEGVDTLYTYPPYGESVRATLDEIRAREKPDETLLVVPEGVMLNYLARRRAPTPYFNFMPPELIMFGEETIVSALRQHPPDLLVWAPRSMPEYGYEGLGRGYGTRLYHWIKQDFHTISDPSAPQRRFPMLLLAPNAGQRPTKP